MRLIACLVALALILYGLIVSLPLWTARIEEHRRTTQFQEATRRTLKQSIPDCPPIGPELDRFLESQQKDIVQVQLWKPVCRIQEPQTGKVIIVSNNRSDFADCKERHLWTPVNFRCALEEPLRFLDDPTRQRTWARLESFDQHERPVIWVTSRQLAWQEHLALEHQIRVSLVLAMMFCAAFGAWIVFRWRLALRLHAADQSNEEPMPPRFAELVLQGILGRRSPAMVGDLRDAYNLKRDAGWEKVKADRWYRRELLRSITGLLAGRMTNLIERGGPWPF